MSFDIIVAIVGPLTSPSLMAKDEAGGGAAVRECECDAVVWHGVCVGQECAAMPPPPIREIKGRLLSRRRRPPPSQTDRQRQRQRGR